MARPHPLSDRAARRPRTVRRSLLALIALLGVAVPGRAQPVPARPRPPVTGAAAPAPRTAPRHVAALEVTLRDLALDPLCVAESPVHARCEARVTAAGGEDALTLRAVASDETHTVYLYTPDLARAAPDAPSTPALLRRIAELNHELLLGKLEWDAGTGEIRLSMVLPTQGGLDREALGTMTRALLALAARLGPTLRGSATP